MNDMIRMKKWLFYLPALLVMVGMSSCMKDDDNSNGPYRSWVTVYTNDKTPTLVTDRKIYLHVTNAQGDSTFYKVGDRGNVVYKLVDATHSDGSTYQVVMSEFYKATVKPFVKNSDGNFKDARLAAFSGGIISENYLNVLVKTYDSDEPTNTLELVRYPDEETHLATDSFPVIRCRLQHNVGSVKSTMTTKAVCFDLSHLKIEYPGKRGFILRFSWKSTGDEQEYDMRYSIAN